MALKPQPIEFPQPTMVRGGQLVAHALPVPTPLWTSGVTWVQYPESAPATTSFACGATGLGTISGTTVAEATAWDFTDAASEGYTFTQLPFTIYRALRNTALGEMSMVGSERLTEANALMLRRWISIAVAQELITGEASGGLSFVDSAARVAGLEGLYGMSAAMDEYAQLAGAVRGFVHLPSIVGGIPTGSWADGVWGDGVWGELPDASDPSFEATTTSRFSPIVDAGYQIDFMRNKAGVGSGYVAGFVSGQVYLSASEPLAIVTNEDMLVSNVIEAFEDIQAILVFNPLTVVSFAADDVAAYSVTPSPLA